MESPFEQQVSDLDEFDFSYEFFDSLDIECVPTDSIPLVDFCSPSEVDLTNYKPSSLGSIESSSIDSTLTLHLVEDSKVTCVSAKVTRIGLFLLNMILCCCFLETGFVVGFTTVYWPHLVVQAVIAFACALLALMSLMPASTLLAHCISPHICSHRR